MFDGISFFSDVIKHVGDISGLCDIGVIGMRRYGDVKVFWIANSLSFFEDEQGV